MLKNNPIFLSSMNIAITGQEGLIGSAFKKRLLDAGHKIILEMDSRSGMPIDALENVCNLNGQIDIFIHMADFCKINKCIEYPALGNINGITAHRVMEFCRRNKVPKVIYFSSSRVLSSEKNPYTAGKIYGEELCKAYKDCYNIDYLIIRPSTVYNAFDDLSHRIIDIYIRNALKHKDLIVFGDPETKTLDFTHVDDFVDAVLIAMRNKWNTCYNISGGEEFRVYNLAKMIIEKTNSQSKIVVKSEETAQPQKVKINGDKLRNLGYNPKISLEQGITECVEFYKGLLK
jgi:GDP-L-fucose synthase